MYLVGSNFIGYPARTEIIHIFFLGNKIYLVENHK